MSQITGRPNPNPPDLPKVYPLGPVKFTFTTEPRLATRFCSPPSDLGQSLVGKTVAQTRKVWVRVRAAR
eukprot:scaffold85528_cov52-Attheya_sp.AAC.1